MERKLQLMPGRCAIDQQEERHSSDHFETMQPNPAQNWRPGDDSTSSEADAGLDVVAGEEPRHEPDSEGKPQEINMTDLAAGRGPGSLEAPELSDLNAPGEIDIEELDDHDLDNTSLPPEARLNPLTD